MMKKGFRTAPSPTKKQVNSLEAELQNISMANRLSQMMIKQLMENIQNMSSDLNSMSNQLYSLQYKFLSIQKHLNLDSNALEAIANEQRLIDFNEAADLKDKQENLLTTDVVTEESIVTLTSTATTSSGEDAGIFRSRIQLKESGVPALIQGLTGKKVGDKVEVLLNGVNHLIEVLSIKVAPPTAEETAQEVAH